jgi:hypothetical protein
VVKERAALVRGRQTTLLVVVAALAGLGGLLTLSNATLGVGLIGFGCLMAILARLAQAQAYYDRESE